MAKLSKNTPPLVGVVSIVATESLRPNPWNYNRQSKFIYAKLKESILTFGFVDPVIVRSGNESGPFAEGGYEIIGGEHRWRCAGELGMTAVKINDLGNLSDLDARRLTITLNETKGSPDEDALSALVRMIHTTGGEDALQVLPYDDHALANLLDEPLAPEIHHDEPLPSDHVSRLRVIDLGGILEMTGMSQKDMADFFEAIRTWVYARTDRTTPAWQDLQHLLHDTPAEQ